MKYSNQFNQLVDLLDGDLPIPTDTQVNEDDNGHFDRFEGNNEFWTRFMRKIAKDENYINWDRFFIDNDVMGVHSSLLIRCFTQESTGEHWNLTRMEFIARVSADIDAGEFNTVIFSKIFSNFFPENPRNSAYK